MPPIQDTAIILFSRTASAEAHHKQLHNRGGQAHSIAKLLIGHAQKTARRTNLPFFYFSEKKQRGNTFGERLCHAIETVFEKGFEKVVTIGNDCPSLTTLDILTAVEKLNTSETVLGPTTDGGAYLIGIRKKNFDRNLFLSVAWQTHTVSRDLAAAAHTIELLPIKSDFDKPEDLKNALQDASIWLKKAFTALLSIPLKTIFKDCQVRLSILYFSAKLLRAPPFWV